MKFIRHAGEWVPADRFQRRAPVFPAIIRDTMEPVMSMATGQMHDSKSAIRREYRERGYVELGNDVRALDPPAELDDRDFEAGVAEAWDMLEQGYQPAPCETIEPGTRVLTDV